MSTPVLLSPPEARLFNIWAKSELYWGEDDAADGVLYYPRVGDMVMDLEIGIYQVTAISNYIPTISLLTRFSVNSTFNAESTSLITAISGYQPTIVQRAYIDRDQTPAVVTLDCHFIVYGANLTNCIFFRGTDVSIDGEIISEVYNSSGVLVANEVPLASMNDGNTVWRPSAFNTTKAIDAGEILTAVFYKNDGTKEGVQTFTVIEGASIRPNASSDKVITSVDLISDLFDPQDGTILLNTSGVPTSSLFAKGKINYSDGSFVEHNIDGVKMVLFGLDKFDNTRIGRPFRISLGYYPGPSEPFINGSLGEVPFISKSYYLSNKITDTAYALKVYIIPSWDETNSNWTYSYRLVNLERDLEVNVTSLVTVLQEGTGTAISGTDFTNKQDIVLSVDMEAVAPTIYSNFVHTQLFDITIDQPGAISGDYFIIDYVNDGTNPYGSGLKAEINASGTIMVLDNDQTLESEWLDILYYSTEPLFDQTVLSSAPAPTHFALEYKGVISEKIAVAEWAGQIDLPAGMDVWEESNTVIIRWLLETAEGDELLSLAPLYMEQTL